jgi:hypothetical protein
MPIVTQRAALTRIKRALSEEGRFVRTNRKVQTWQQGIEAWRYWVIDASRNLAVGCFDDPEEYGRKLGVISEYESVAQ